MQLEQIRDIEAQHLKAHNAIQIELAKRKYGKNLSDDQFGKWANEYSKSYRFVMDKLVDEQPTILDEWEVESNQEDILKKIEGELY